MTILSAIAWGLAALATLLWIWLIRDSIARDNGVSPEVINTGLLFVVALAVVGLLRAPGAHLLWAFPLAWGIGQLSGRPPLSLLDYPGAWFLWLVTLGVRRQ